MRKSHEVALGGHFLEAGYRKLALLASVAVLGVGVAQPDAASAEYAKPPIYGLAGLGFENPDNVTTEQPDWSQVSGPNSAYPTQFVRTAANLDDLAGSEATVEAYLKYAQDYLGWQPGSGRVAPVVVSFELDNEQVTAANGGVDVCDRDMPGLAPNSVVTNENYNPKRCSGIAMSLMQTVGKAIILNYPVEAVSPTNEPDFPYSSSDGKPTNFGEGGPKLAVKLYEAAVKISRSLPLNLRPRIVAGEFANASSQYEHAYLKKLSKDVQVGITPAVTDIGDHSYHQVTCAEHENPSSKKTTDMDKFVGDLASYKMLRPIEEKGSMWILEVAPRLDSPYNCPNAKLLANGDHSNSSTLTPTDLSEMAEAQLKSIKSMEEEPEADTDLQFRMAYYDMQPASENCYSGGTWDSSPWSPLANGTVGAERPIFFALTHQKTPKELLHPRTSEQIQNAARVNLAPAHWTKGGPPAPGDCHYDNPALLPK